MAEHEVTLEVHIESADKGSGQVDRFARELYAEMRQLAVEIDPAKGGAAPEGAKAVELAVLGAWMVKMAPTLVPPLIGLLKDWITRHPAAPLKVTVKRGNKSVAIEYDPHKTSLQDIEATVNRLMK